MMRLDVNLKVALVEGFINDSKGAIALTADGSRTRLLMDQSELAKILTFG